MFRLLGPGARLCDGLNRRESSGSAASASSGPA